MAGVVLVSGNTVFVEEHRSVIHGDCPIQKPIQGRKSQGTSTILFSTICGAAFEPLSAIIL